MVINWQGLMRPWLWFWLAFCSTLIFWISDWDPRIARWFYIESHQHWLIDHHHGFKLIFYYGIPYISLFILLATLIIIIRSYWLDSSTRLRLYAIYILLVFLLGPGLIINVILKDHWGRARPVQVVELGGTEAYTPPWYFVAKGTGRSFPSGHSSVGFALIAFWFVWRRQRPYLAKFTLITSLSVGSCVGWTRMAAGGHFLSDIIWSGWICLFVAWWVYHYLLRIPERERLQMYNLQPPRTRLLG